MASKSAKIDGSDGANGFASSEFDMGGAKVMRLDLE